MTPETRRELEKLRRWIRKNYIDFVGHPNEYVIGIESEITRRLNAAKKK